MPVEIIQVDSFTDRPFAGNPAGVCLLAEAADPDWMQAVATEMNLSETAFLVRRDDAFELRWFTPAAEVDLCGHATLAGAHALWELGHLGPEEAARFDTRSGRLTAVRRGDAIEMDFPALPARAVATPPELAEALGAEAQWVGETSVGLLVLLDSEATVRGLAPDGRGIERLSDHAVLVTARASEPPFDFVSRYFAPRFGIDEDPVTGSAHCALGPFWQARLGRDELTGFQASRRGGVVHVTVAGDRVRLRGQAVTVMTAVLSDAAVLTTVGT